VVHPKCAKSSSGSHMRPSGAKADTRHCSAISTSYYRHLRPSSCTTSRCRQQRHCHCPCRKRWRIDRPLHRAHPRGAPKIIASPFFHEDGFDPGEEASLRIPEIGQHSKGGFVGGGVPHLRNLISYPLCRQMPADVAVATHAMHGRASTA
jgi:hypothetical protein